MNPILAKLASKSLTAIFFLWTAYLALHLAGTPVPDAFVTWATAGVCFKEGCAYLGGRRTPVIP